MPDIRSPIASVRKAGRYGASFDEGAGVTLSDAPLEYLVQIAGWDAFEAAVLPALEKLGFSDAGDYQTACHCQNMRLFRTAPDRILIAGQSAIILPDSLMDNPALVVLDLGHARAQIAIEGQGAEDLMPHLAPIDFRSTTMPAGNFVQTGLHHVGVLIHRTSEQRFEILVPLASTRSVWELICLNAAPFGYDVKIAS